MASGSKVAPTRQPTQIESLFCGVVAGAVEGAITYPAEFLKTKAQFSSSGSQHTKRGIVPILRETIRSQGVRGLYSGSGAMITGNGLKAGVRFMTYDTFKEMLRDPNGKLTPARTMLAGLAAGTAEAILAVTPSETIKTKLIQDAARPQPLYTSTINGTLTICRTEGFGGIYRGLGPTIAKQGANSAVRFSSFNTLKSLALDYQQPASGKLSSPVTFLLGAGAGIITVYTTMPLDNIKTRMQSLEARTRYRNSFDCLAQIVRTEGVGRLWGGTMARLARLSLSGGIVFTVYEKLMGVLLAL